MKLFAALFLFMTGFVSAQTAWDTLPAADVRNGSNTLAGLKDAARAAHSLTLRLVDPNGKFRCLATRIGSSIAVSKLSELPEEVFFEKSGPGTRSKPLRILAEWKDWDLCALGIAPEDSPADTPALPSVSPLVDDPESALWVVSAADNPQGIRLGNLSATARKIDRSRASLGILMAPETQKNGVKIDEVSPVGPAGIAGILAGDVIQSCDGKKTPNREKLIAALRQRAPGDEVPIELLRNGSPLTVKVTLASQHRVVRDFNDSSGYDTEPSARSDGFPRVFQHDTMLSADEMGGPVVDLAGRLVGINLARQDRVTTFIVPWNQITSLLHQAEISP